MNAGDLFLDDELFTSDDKQTGKALKSPLALKLPPSSEANDGLNTPSIYIDTNPVNAGKFKWNLN